MKCFVTGGAGFIGSHLTEQLLDRGYRVCGIDDLSTGSMENIEHLKGRNGFQYVIDSVLNRPLVAELMDGADVVFHLAAAVGVRLIVESPVRTIETNVRGTEVVLDLASRKKKLVVVFSTSEVYGKSSADRFSEADDLVLGPTTKSRWSYATSKILDEFLALAYWKERGVPVIIVRLFNTVGPRQTGRYGMVIPRFVDQALAGQPISVYGDGKQTRTFCHVRDAVGAIARLAETPQAVGEIFNVGGMAETSIHDLALRVKEWLGSASPIEYIPYEEAYEEGFEDMRRRVPDLRKIRRAIGYEPRLSLQNIVQDVADHVRRRAQVAAA